MARLIRTEKEVEGRYEEVWIVVEEDSLDQWPAGPLEIVGRDALRVDGRERATGQAVYTADLAKPGMLHTAVLRSPHPRARVASIDLAPALAHAGRPRRDRPGRHRAADRRLLVPGRGDRRGVRGHARSRTHGVARDRVRVRGARAAARPGRGGAPGLAARRGARALARRLRAGPRGGRRGRRGGVPHAGRPPQLDGDAPGGRRVDRGRRRGAHLDAVHLGHPRRGCRRTRAPGRQGARRLPVHGRRLRLEERPGRLHVHRRRAREAHAPAGEVRAHAPRGEHRGGQPERDDPAADGRRPQRRDADRARRRVRERRRLERLVGRHRGADADALRVPERQDDHVRREAQPAADEGVPRTRVRRRDVRPRSAARRARGEARRRSARAAAAQPHGARCRGRASVQRQEPARVLPARRAALGAQARGARALDRDGEARRRDGVADLVRRRRTAELRVDPRRLRRSRDGRDGDAGHRHRHADRDGADRSGGARHPARARHRVARRLGPRPVRDAQRRLVDDAVGRTRPSARRPPTHGSRSRRSRSSAA